MPLQAKPQNVCFICNQKGYRSILLFQRILKAELVDAVMYNSFGRRVSLACGDWGHWNCCGGQQWGKSEITGFTLFADHRVRSQ